jgi:hypothetical protein
MTLHWCLEPSLACQTHATLWFDTCPLSRVTLTHSTSSNSFQLNELPFANPASAVELLVNRKMVALSKFPWALCTVNWLTLWTLAVEISYLTNSDVAHSRNPGYKPSWKNESPEIFPSASLVLGEERSPTEFDDNGHSALHSSTTIWSLVSLLVTSDCSTPFLSVGINRLTNDNKYSNGI